MPRPRKVEYSNLNTTHKDLQDEIQIKNPNSHSWKILLSFIVRNFYFIFFFNNFFQEIHKPADEMFIINSVFHSANHNNIFSLISRSNFLFHFDLNSSLKTGGKCCSGLAVSCIIQKNNNNNNKRKPSLWCLTC